MTSLRHLALYAAAFLTSLRTLSPERLDNGTDFVFYLGRWLDVGVLDVGATGQALAVFVVLLGLELACALVALFSEQYRTAAIGTWAVLLLYQIAANATSWIGALNSNCGVGLFRDDPRLIAAVHVAVAVALAVGAGGRGRR